MSGWLVTFIHWRPHTHTHTPVMFVFALCRVLLHLLQVHERRNWVPVTTLPALAARRSVRLFRAACVCKACDSVYAGCRVRFFNAANTPLCVVVAPFGSRTCCTLPLTQSNRLPRAHCRYSFVIFLYDEVRKYLMRRTSHQAVNPVTGQSVRTPGWLERNSYY